MVARPSMRAALLMTTVSLLAGCAVPPAPPAAAPGPPAPTTSEPRPSAPAPAPAPAAPAMPVASPPPPAAPATPAQQQQAHRQALAAVELLENGNEEQARSEIAAALAIDPNSRLALNLLRQLDSDPVALLGRESFTYTVRPADTLSRIAGRFLGDIFSFYALARYNDIKVPKQVAAGQVLRIPGRAQAEREPAAPAPAPAPARGSPPAPAQAASPIPAPVVAAPMPAAAPAEPSAGVRALRSGEAAERAGELERALGDYNRAASLDQPEAVTRAGNVRRRLVSTHTQAARAAMANQDLDATIRNWDRVLEIDAGNETARLERQRAVTLRDKLRSLPR